MTRGGDHGGESYLETVSALLVYSPRQLFCQEQVLNYWQLTIYKLSFTGEGHPFSDRSSPNCIVVVGHTHSIFQSWSSHC